MSSNVSFTIQLVSRTRKIGRNYIFLFNDFKQYDNAAVLNA
jgi:hypothetical protein